MKLREYRFSSVMQVNRTEIHWPQRSKGNCDLKASYSTHFKITAFLK